MTEVRRLLEARIRSRGPVTFADFMDTALYDPELGYYASGRPRTTRRGDFLTSPELTPAFGRLWADGFEQIWDACGRPEPFELVEIGPGEGGFAAAVLRSAHDPFASALRMTLVERLDRPRARQRERLRGDDRVAWVAEVSELPGGSAHCVFANEVLDNIPTHILERTGEGLAELYVDIGDDDLQLTHGPLSSPELSAYVAELGIEPDEAGSVEISPGAADLVARAADVVGHGVALFVDYGLDMEELLRRPGTLVAYGSAGPGGHVLAEPGERDLTAHVNWTAVGRALASASMTVVGPLTQRRVLRSLGAARLEADAAERYRRSSQTGRGADAVRALSARQALIALVDPAGLGGLCVVAGCRGIDVPGFLR